MIGLLIILCLSATTFQSQLVVDYNKQPYTALRDVLGSKAIENSDACGDRLTHITSERDPNLNRNVFLYHLHINSTYADSDRCNDDKTRQRCETSVQETSPSWMHGQNGMSFTFAWKVYLDPNFQVSGLFCHFHQIKLDGADVGTPNLTLSAKSSDIQLENQGTVLAKAPLSSFKGTWIQIKQKITYGPNGCVEFTAHRIRDGYLLMNHNGCGVKLDSNGGMIRPKFGFYRSIENRSPLRSEAVRIADLCIGSGNSTCNYDQNGNKHSPAPSLSLTSQ